MRRLRTILGLFVLSTSLITMVFQKSGAKAGGDVDQQIEARVNSILSQLTIEEKIDLIGGVDGFFIRDVPRLNLPRLKMADGPLGVRNFGPATAMAGGIGLAATWNPNLAERVGTEIGRDARAKGVHFLLGPGVNISRAPMNGRNFEYFGEDPFLASRIAVGYIQGVQSQRVSATIKHYLGNNSEFDRHNTDSIIDERALREIYLPVFEAAVKEAHVGALMDSYNLTNGSHMSENKYLLNDILKREWDFDGVVMSDWGATYNGIAAANNGQDLEMPSGEHMNRKSLLPAIERGEVAAATIDDKVRRILRVAVRFGWLDREQVDWSIPRFNQQGRQAALDAARESLVLLKNEGGILPLNKAKIKSVLVVGPNAYPAVPGGGGSSRVEPFAAVSYLEGLSRYLGSSAQVYSSKGLPTFAEIAEATAFTTAPTNGEPGLNAQYFNNSELQGTPTTTRVDRRINFGSGSRSFMPQNSASSRWTGYFTPRSAGPHDLLVHTGGEGSGVYRVVVDDKLVLESSNENRALVKYVTITFDQHPHKIVLEHRGRPDVRLRLGIVRQGQFVTEDAKKLAPKADVVIVAAGFDLDTESEGADRTFSLPPGQNELIQEMSAANKNTIVVITSGGSVDMSAWIDRVPGLIETWYPGQEGGTALAEVLFGTVNPSGRLPVTFERRWEDNPVHDSYYPEAGSKRVVYKEGVFVGYRGYERAAIKPQFPFGAGLSYTTFKYTNLTIKPITNSSSNSTRGPQYEVSFDIKNSGARDGADVSQVYVGSGQSKIARPIKELKGFAKVNLRPGETKRVSVVLDARAFSYYDVNSKLWRADAGDFDIRVGRSSEQIELTGKLNLPTAIAMK